MNSETSNLGFYIFKIVLFFVTGQPVPSPSRLAIFQNRIYWSDSTKQGVLVVNKFKGANSIEYIYSNKDLREARGVRAVHDLLQRRGNEIFYLL